MTTLEDFVTVTITTVAQTPSQVGFGTPLVAGYHALDTLSRVRSYRRMNDAVSDGFVSTGITAGIYAALNKIFSQKPRPTEVKVGRLSSAPTMLIKLVPTSATEGVIFNFEFGKLNDTLETFTRTVPSSSSISAECTAIKNALEDIWPAGSAATVASFATPKVTMTGLTDITADMVGEWITISGATTTANNGTFLITDYVSATSLKYSNASAVSPDAADGTIDWTVGMTVTTPGSAYVLITANKAGEFFNVKNWTNTLELSETTSVAGTMSTDFAAISAEDNDWYGLALANNSEAYVEAVAPIAETGDKLFLANTSDFGCGDSGNSTDILSDLQAAAYFKTGTFYNGTELCSYLGAGLLGEMLPWLPGSSTFANKTIAGATVDSHVSSTQEGQILTKSGNVYTRTSGRNLTRPGVSAAGEFLDIAFGRDWLKARLQEAVFGVITGVRKVPYTDTGVDMVVAAVKGVLQNGVDSGFLAADPAPIVTAPKVKDIDDADKANRILPDVNFSATLAGAIHAAEISGTISV